MFSSSATAPVPKLAIKDTERDIPDWRDASAYPDADTLTQEQLAAEFLRRNSDYRRWWQRQLDANEEGSITRLDFDGLKQFGLACPIGTRGVARHAFFIPRSGRRLRGSTYPLGADEVAMVFDLSLPLDGQVALAYRDLEGHQQHRVKQGKIAADGTKQVRKSKDYVLYLRVLDADETGATDAEIREVLYSHLNNLHPECSQAHALSDDRKAARELRDGGYRRLAAKKDERLARRRRRSTP
jgi:hypothetical protein